MPALTFADDVVQEIEAAAAAIDARSRSAHVECAVLRFQAGGQVSDDPARCRKMIETAVFAQIVFGAEPSDDQAP